MKRIVAALLFLVMALSLAACGEQTETIYVISESTRTVYGQEIKTVHTYSDNGNLIKTEMYLAGELYQTLSRRTSQGVVFITVTDRNGKESTQATRTTYDEKGNPLVVETSVGESVTSRVNYTYDENGNVLTVKTTTAGGVSLTTYTYDDRGNVTSRIVTVEGDETKTETTTYAYDERDYVTLEETVDVQGNPVRKMVHEYQENANRTTTYYGSDGEPDGQVVTSEYDERGNLVKETTVIDGEVAQVIVNTYIALEVPVKE